MKSSNTNDILSLPLLPNTLLIYISSFVSITTVNQLQITCKSLHHIFLREITKINVHFKIMNQQVNMFDFITNTDIPWHQYRLSYSTTYDSLMYKFQLNFDIPKHYQVLTWTNETATDFCTVPQESRHRQLYDINPRKCKNKRIPDDIKLLLIDSSKFKVFIPKNESELRYADKLSIQEIVYDSYQGLSLRYMNFRYINLFFSSSFSHYIDLDCVLIHDHFNVNTISLTQYLTTKIRNSLSDCNCNKQQLDEILDVTEFALYLLNTTDTNKKTLLFLDDDGYVSYEGNTYDISNDLPIVYICKPVTIKSVLMDNIPVLYQWSDEYYTECKLTVMDVFNTASEELFRVLIVKETDSYHSILVYECINNNSMQNGTIPMIYDRDENDVQVQYPWVCWKGINFIDWKKNQGSLKEHCLCFVDDRGQSLSIAAQFCNLFNNIYNIN
eukprot:176934_1